MLLGQDRRGREEGDLLAVHHGLERRPQRDLGLAVADVAAQQPVHRAGALHVRLDVGDGLQLIRRLLKGEVLLELALPGRVGREGKALLRLALGVELDQVERQLLDRLLDLGLLPLPLRAAQAVDARGGALRADVLLDAVELVGGHVELVAALILDEQIVAVGALAAQAHGALIYADAVRLVHDVVADLQVGERRDLLARLLLARARALLRHAEDVPVGDDHQLQLRVLKAVRQRQRDDRGLAGGNLLALLAKRAGCAQLRQRREQALAARHAAGEQRHAPAVLPPALQVGAQLLELSLVARGAHALDLHDVLGHKAAHRAQKARHRQRAAARQLRHGVRAVQQQARLLADRLRALERALERLVKLQLAVVAPVAQAVRLVEHDERIVHVVQDRLAARIEQVHVPL